MTLCMNLLNLLDGLSILRLISREYVVDPELWRFKARSMILQMFTSHFDFS